VPDAAAPIVTLTLNPALDCCTETDTIAPTVKLRCAAPRYDPGGGGLNVARAIHMLGGEAVAVFPGGGATAATLEALLAARGTPFERIPIVGVTRESLCVTERTTQRQYRFVLPGPTLSPLEQQTCLDHIADRRPAPRYLVVSGSLPPGARPSLLWRIGDLCRSMDTRLILDTSGEALRQAAGCRAYLIKPNADELGELAGHPVRCDADEDAAAMRLVAMGVAEVVLVSLGARGALLATRAGLERQPAIAVPTRSTVGAGDSMVAAATLGLARGAPLASILRLGLAAGAAALLHPGTELARREDVRRLYRDTWGDDAALDAVLPVTPAMAAPALLPL
jgi:6-phosphofructokinase 2